VTSFAALDGSILWHRHRHLSKAASATQPPSLHRRGGAGEGASSDGGDGGDGGEASASSPLSPGNGGGGLGGGGGQGQGSGEDHWGGTVAVPEGGEAPPALAKDPVLLFGGLVPPALRRSKADFAAALDYYIQVMHCNSCIQLRRPLFARQFSGACGPWRQ